MRLFTICPGIHLTLRFGSTGLRIRAFKLYNSLLAKVVADSFKKDLLHSLSFRGLILGGELDNSPYKRAGFLQGLRAICLPELISTVRCESYSSIKVKSLDTFIKRRTVLSWRGRSYPPPNLRDLNRVLGHRIWPC